MVCPVFEIFTGLQPDRLPSGGTEPLFGRVKKFPAVAFALCSGRDEQRADASDVRVRHDESCDRIAILRHPCAKAVAVEHRCDRFRRDSALSETSDVEVIFPDARSHFKNGRDVVRSGNSNAHGETAGR